MGQAVPKRDAAALRNISLSSPLGVYSNSNGGPIIVAAGANLSVTELRNAARHTVDFSVIAEHHKHGDTKLHIANLSAHGFMIDDANDVARGDRIIIRLPIVGRIEAYAIWIKENRAGFQFERILRLDDFMDIVDELQPNARHRQKG
jgi:hypothetical protein